MMNPLRSDTDTTTIVPLFMKITTDMLKLRLIGLTLLAFSAATAVHAEEKRYVSDELNTSGTQRPSGDNYRLVGTVNAGEEVTLLQTNADTNYGQVRDSSGRTSWIPLKELSTVPSLRTRVPDLENQVKTLTDKLNNIDGTPEPAHRRDAAESGAKRQRDRRSER